MGGNGPVDLPLSTSLLPCSFRWIMNKYCNIPVVTCVVVVKLEACGLRCVVGFPREI